MDTRFELAQDKIPTAWYNALPDLPEPMQPPLHPGTKEPVGPDDLAPLFPMALIEQEMTGAPHRSTSPARCSTSCACGGRRRSCGPAASRGARHAGAHLLQGRVGVAGRIAQAEHRGGAGVSTTSRTARQRLATETGAGQWGSALSFACAQFDLECKVYMVRASYEQKPYRRVLMETWGASVVPSPVDDPSHPGSLGAAISDAVRDAGTRADTHYSLGSVLNHVLLHQTVIGIEAKEQLALAGETRPDVVIGSCGGGSNLGGIALPFMNDAEVRLLAVEPTSCPTLTDGQVRLRLRRHRR